LSEPEVILLAVTGIPSARPWLYGPFRDLFFGCGLLYVVAFAALWLGGDELRDALPMELMPLLLLFTSVPHYGATLLRVYERRQDRRKYRVFGVLATAAVWLWFVAGVYSVAIGSLMLTVYLTWSPWHYSGQNYGIALMFLRRRQIEVTPLAKQLLWASFILSFSLTFLALHAADPDVPYAPLGEYQRSIYRILPLGIPAGVESVLLPAGIAAYLVCLAAAVALLRRRTSWRGLLPSLVLAASQSLWFTVPLVARHTGWLQGIAPLGVDHAAYAFLWVAIAHATQYIWITSYFARQGEPGYAQWSYFGRILFAGAAIWVVPGLMFAPGLLGNVPYDAGLRVLIAAAVNIHHFVLDGAIWKLRDGRIARILLGGQSDNESPPARWWLPRVVYAAGLISVSVLVFAPLERVFGLARAAAAGDLDRVETAAARLGWIGQESALVHVTTALMHQQRGDGAAARRHVAAARAMQPDYATLANLGVYHQRAGDGPAAIAVIRQALATAEQDRDPVAYRLASELLGQLSRR